MDKLLIKFKLQNSEIQNSKFQNYDKLTGTRIKFALKVKPYNFKNKEGCRSTIGNVPSSGS
jgi:hypothetical protein